MTVEPPVPAELRCAVVAEPALRHRVATILEGAGASVVAAVGAPERLSDACGATIPHVTVLSWAPSGDPAVRLVAETLPGTRVVVVLRRDGATDVRAALRAGADGVVVRASAALTLGVVVRSVALGQASVPRERRMDLRDPVLSPREREVLALASKGLANAEIAARLSLAHSTVKRHLSSAYGKLGIRSRDEVVGRLTDGALAEVRPRRASVADARPPISNGAP
jgi:DNA-binding NarL/FixJ family response regulator